MSDWIPIVEIEEFSSLPPNHGLNNKPLEKIQARDKDHPQTKAAFTEIEWKPTAAEQLSSLVRDEIDKDDEKVEPQQEHKLQGMPDLVAAPGQKFDFVYASGRIG